ncbi:MAG: hypothetical protein OEV40_06535 [Acidimicrobiia bacterium]|nr:hypothetical protein [Acidimicrobiia bacterium]
MTATDGPTGDGLDFRCPRCDRETTARFYGPCDDCRGELRATLGSGAREVAAAEYEPKMNVTPNAVATKD